jgi:hypothetical protein
MDIRLIFAVFLWLSMVACAVFPFFQTVEKQRENWLKRLLGFLILLGMALPAWRWRSLTYNGEINVDEGTTIALALKYLHDPIPWRSVDGITCGPLATWVTLWAPLVGLKITYATLRITGLLMVFISAVGTALGMREILGRRLALLATLPPLTLLLTTLNFDFVTFAMEYLPVAICVWAVYLILRQHRSPGSVGAFLVGALTGSLPFTKLQAAPAGVVLYLICSGVIYLQRNPQQTGYKRRLAWLAAGGLFVPALILVPVAAAGVWDEFIYFYLVCGTTYKNEAQQISPLVFLLRGSADFGAYFLAVVSVSVFSLFGLQRSAAPRLLRRWLVGFAIIAGYLGVTLLSVFRSGFGFPHYLLLLVFPLSLLMAWCLKGAILPLNENNLNEPRGLFSGFYALSVVLIVQCGMGVAEYIKINPQLLGPWGAEVNAVVPVLLRYGKPGDSMMVWGWNNKLHAFTGFRPATRFVGLTYIMDPSPNYNRHRDLFLSDLKADKPKLFVDAVDEFRWPTWPPGAQARHDMIPELSQWVRQEYNLVADVQTAPQKLPVRVYVRREQ